MRHELVSEGGGFRVGEVVRISCEPVEARVASTTDRRFSVTWPWRRIDPGPSTGRWNGQLSFPRNADDAEWRNTPWRVEPDPRELAGGHVCILGVPPTDARIISIRRFTPPADFGWLPRPEWTIGARALADEGHDEAGFVLYVEAAEPLIIEKLAD